MTKVVSSLVAVGLAASIAGCAQPVHSDDAGMFCVERLRIPIYPALAVAAGITGDVVAAVFLAPNGSLQTVSFEMRSGTQTSEGVLFPAVEKALRASQFAPTCGGRTVKLILKFRIDPTQEDDEPQRVRVSFECPNQFQISIPIQTQLHGPDLIKTPK